VLDIASGDYILLLDSDILYIPGSARGLLETLEKLPDAYCLGIHNERWDGTPDMDEADKKWVGTGRVRFDHPIAWTQFGLFKTKLLKKYNFPEHGAFKGPGYGFEDDYVNAQMVDAGYIAYHCSRPLYYHKAHTTKRKTGKHLNEEERKAQLYKDFPKYEHWTDKVKRNQLEEMTDMYLANKE